MSSALPGFPDASSEDRGPVREDVESPRRRLDNVLRKSDDDELLLVCEIVVGVMGGVMVPLSRLLHESDALIAAGRILVGESGGVDTVASGFEYALPLGMVRWYPSLALVWVSS